jgi:hypothetical protein
MKKISADEFLKSKGWDDKNPIVGGIFFKGITELLEEYVHLQPSDINTRSFPTREEIDAFADLYRNGQSYVYAGVEFVREWMRERRLLY